MTDPKTLFTHIYQNNTWNGISRSGPGSDPMAVQGAQRGLKAFILEHDVFNILDAPCGLFGWQQEFLHQYNIYRGIDIVDEVIKKNTEFMEGRANFRFLTGDVTRDLLPPSDLVIVRDFLIHLPLRDCMQALGNLIFSGTKFIALTHFPDCRENVNIPLGGFAERNMLLSPFSLGNPVRVIDESTVTTNGFRWPRKQLLVFNVENKKWREGDR